MTMADRNGYRIPLLAVGLTLAATLVGCSQDPAPEAGSNASGRTPADWSAPVATFTGGSISLEDIVARVAEDRARQRPLPECSRRDANTEATLTCYQEIARDLALEALLMDEEVGGEAPGLTPEQELQRLTALGQLRANELSEAIEVEGSAVEAEFEARQEEFRQPARVVLWNLLRRHADPEDPAPTLAVLEEVRDRFNAGETFAELAREYSESETRQRNGFVGQVEEGRMAKKLEAVAFALEPGEISEPIEIPGGAILLHISEKSPGYMPTLDEVRGGITNQLRQELLVEAIRAEVAAVAPPEGSVVPAVEEFVATLETAEDEDVLLSIGGLEAKRRDFPRIPDEELEDPEVQESLREFFAQRRDFMLLAWLTAESDESWAVALRDQVDGNLADRAGQDLADRWIDGEIDALLDREPDRLEDYYADNQSNYQTPLRFRVLALDIPLGDDPLALSAELDQLAATGVSGEQELTDLAERHGGEVTDHDWLAFDQLAELFPGKAASLIVQTEAGGVVTPYQQDEALHLLWIRERSEPEAQAFEDISDRVREDYVRRFSKQMSAQLREQKLSGVDFAFDEAAVRSLLAPPDSVAGG